MASHSSGRHRAPGRFNPVSELSGIVASAAQPAVKTSAVIAASGGLVASFALPASAATASPKSVAKATTVAAPVAVQAPETAAPRGDQRLRCHRLQGDRQAQAQAQARRRTGRSAHQRPQQLCDRQPLDRPQ